MKYSNSKLVPVLIFVVVASLFSQNLLGQNSELCELTPTSNVENWKRIKVNGLSVLLPECLKGEKKRGIHGEFWYFDAKNLDLTIYTHFLAPRPGGIEQRLTSYSDNLADINGIRTWTWYYEKKSGKAKFTNGARFYVDNKSDGDAVTIILHSDSSSVKDIARIIFGSVSFKKRTSRDLCRSLHCK